VSTHFLISCIILFKFYQTIVIDPYLTIVFLKEEGISSELIERLILKLIYGTLNYTMHCMYMDYEENA